MSRNASGTYTLPSGNPVVTATTITSTWANNTLSDIASELSDSLSRSGKGGMTAAMRGIDGTVGNPSVSFTADPTTGIWRPGASLIEVSAGGTPGVRFGTNGRMLFGSSERLQLDATGVRLGGVGYLSAQPTFRNEIINGDFSIWQRATSQTTSGFGSVDRWSNAHFGSSKTTSRQSFAVGQTDVPGDVSFFCRTVVTSVANAGHFVNMRQPIEGVRSLAGRSVRVSFYAKADLARPIAIEFEQNFGTGGSPSTPVNGIGAQKFNLTTSWQKFSATVSIPSISGKTLGTDGNDHLSIFFWFDAGATYDARTAALGQQSGTFDIALVQVEEGGADTSFEYRPPQVELALCQRFYEETGVGDGTVGVFGYNLGSNSIYAMVPYKVTKRGTTTVTVVGTWGVLNAGQPTVASISTSNCLLAASLTATGTGFAYNSNAGNKLTFSAEL